VLDIRLKGWGVVQHQEREIRVDVVKEVKDLEQVLELDLNLRVVSHLYKKDYLNGEKTLSN